jgi:DNA-directed RNA polymerase specialized sigma24 family protein
MLYAEVGMSVVEIADVQGVCTETAKARIRYARDKLAKLLRIYLEDRE